MDGVDLELEVGKSVQLTFGVDEKGPRHIAHIIGFVRPVSIILNSPSVDGKPMLLREGQIATARFLGANNVYAFNTRILTTFLKPFPHIHIAYPTEIESATVRQDERIRTNIDATVRCTDGHESKTTIVDLSANGALVVSADILGEVGQTLSVSVTVDFNGVLKSVAVPAILRNVCHDKQKSTYSHGVQFKIGTHTDFLMLQGVVYNQILRTEVRG